MAITFVNEDFASAFADFTIVTISLSIDDGAGGWIDFTESATSWIAHSG